MLAAGNGRIVNLVSRAAYSPGVSISAYAASKAALLRFGEVLAHQLAATPLRTCARRAHGSARPP